jgi:DNA-binding PadR family transcriptional regulator
MNQQDIYAKTDKGLEEMQSRKYKLPQAMRSILIMIDGATSTGVFLKQAAALGNVSTMLTELEEQGFIKKTSAPAPVEKNSGKTAEKESGKSADKSGGGLIDLTGIFTPVKDAEGGKK